MELLVIKHTCKCPQFSSFLADHLVRCTQNLVHALKLLSPQSNLSLNRYPLLLFNLFQLVRLDHNLLVQLVNLRVNNFVRYRFNRPHLNLINTDVKQLRKLLKAETGLVCAQWADLHVGLLLKHVLLAKSLLRHQCLKLAQLGLKIFWVRLREQTHELKHLLMFLKKIRDKLYLHLAEIW